MKKSRIVILIIGVVALVWLILPALTKGPLDPIFGWFTGEPYQDGKSISHWAKKLREGTAREKWEAAKKLREAGQKAKSALAALVDTVEDSHTQWDDRMQLFQWTAETLGELGPEARGAVTALRNAHLETHVAGMEWTINALCKIDPEEAYRLLEFDLTTDSESRRERAVKDLAKRPEFAKRAERSLRRAAKDPDENVRNAAQSALRGI